MCLATPESVGAQLLGVVPELTAMLLAEEAPGLIGPAAGAAWRPRRARYDALVVGPGLGPPALDPASRARLPARAAAAGGRRRRWLNALAAEDGWWRPLSAPVVLTPHPGEFARLLRPCADQTLSDDDERARWRPLTRPSRWGQVVVLKGARTRRRRPRRPVLRSDVATPAWPPRAAATCWPASIGAFLAAGCSPLDAAACGVAVHGAAGLLAERRIGRAGVIARDLAACCRRRSSSSRRQRTA